MNRKLRVGAVSYLNTKPLVYGFEQGMMQDEIELNFEYPSKVAAQLLNDEIDIGLVPVAVIPSLKTPHIISDYCIGTEGEVASVCLFSEVPIDQIASICLDYQSRTSVVLLKILLKKYWKISPQLIASTSGYESEIKGNVAGLVIGDRALIKRAHSTYIYDLGTAWKEMTGLPFVFAVWLSNKDIPQQFKNDFNNATASGLNRLKEVASAIHFLEYDLHEYYTININYEFNKQKKVALKLFLELLAENNY